mgnify:CR=1 FL=1
MIDHVHLLSIRSQAVDFRPRRIEVQHREHRLRDLGAVQETTTTQNHSNSRHCILRTADRDRANSDAGPRGSAFWPLNAKLSRLGSIRDSASCAHATRTEDGPMPRPSVIAWLALGFLTACTAPAWTWSGLREDPAPSGAQYLRSYKESFYQSLGDEFDEAWTEAQFLEHIQSARVLFLGDHHTDAALHRRQLKLLDTLRAADIPLVFGLEAIGEQDRPLLRQYLMGSIDMDRLTARIESRWPGSWLSSSQLDSAFYRAVVRRAREWQSPTFALEPVPRLPLNLRDPLIAENIRLASERHPDRLEGRECGLVARLTGFEPVYQRADRCNAFRR